MTPIQKIAAAAAALPLAAVLALSGTAASAQPD